MRVRHRFLLAGAATLLAAAADQSVNCSTPGRSVPVTVQGRNLTVGGQPIFLTGVAWNPYGWGTSPDWGQLPQYAHFVDHDAALMQSAGINAVRTYKAITDVNVLDRLWERGIYVIMTIFYDPALGDTAASAASIACEIRSHPAVLMWLVMNEPNFYYGASSNFLADAESAIQAIKAVDDTRPVAVCWGELPTTGVVNSIPSADVWSSNIYRGTSFHGAFTQWEQLSTKPWFVAEYGVDSYSSTLQAEDQKTRTR
jgi:beta-galactosidase/beta-glucuronidase